MKPKYCPNCGKKIKDCQAFVGMNGSESGWDCYCKYCHWSGDVLPDFGTVKEFKKAKREFEKK